MKFQRNAHAPGAIGIGVATVHHSVDDYRRLPTRYVVIGMPRRTSMISTRGRREDGSGRYWWHRLLLGIAYYQLRSRLRNGDRRRRHARR